MTKPIALCCVIGMAGAVAPAAFAQDASTAGGPSFFLSQKAWAADWSFAALGNQLVPPSSQSPAPTLQPFLTGVDSDHVLSITTFGARIDRWTVAASFSPSARFDTPGLHGGSLRRTEYDFTLGYAVSPNIGLALIYKVGEADARAPNDSFAPETLSSRQKLRGLLVGVSANAPVSDALAVYGSLAYGPRGRVDLGIESLKADLKYTIGELGVSYRLPVSFANLSLQAGYRYQDVKYEDVILQTFSLTPAPVELRRESASAKSTTKGIFAGVTIVF